MRTRTAAAGSALFLLLAPGSVTVLVPWLLTGFHARPATGGWVVARVVGALLIVVGGSFVVGAFVRFVREGLGTPAPVAPPTRLVVGGVYRYLRNPMYVAVTAVIVGETLVLGQLVLLVLAAVALAAMVAFVKLYEEPDLAQRFGEEYERYRRAVPGWWPRLRPWTPQ
ncbi:MAG TPA: isoprenylcysteine carboxylmethyltransferase family protein [Micromonosporaceae bacterium]|jgi:protein-S-isoprenylcysteine O-methyltransferase Ste14